MRPHRREQGVTTCMNARRIKGREIEARVLAAIKERLLAPERMALAVEERDERRTSMLERSRLAGPRRKPSSQR